MVPSQAHTTLQKASIKANPPRYPAGRSDRSGRTCLPGRHPCLAGAVCAGVGTVSPGGARHAHAGVAAGAGSCGRPGRHLLRRVRRVRRRAGRHGGFSNRFGRSIPSAMRHLRATEQRCPSSMIAARVLSCWCHGGAKLWSAKNDHQCRQVQHNDGKIGR